MAVLIKFRQGYKNTLEKFLKFRKKSEIYVENVRYGVEMLIKDKKRAPSCVQEPKPGVHPLRAEVPCNYIYGRLAAALQSVFVSCTPLPPVFYNLIQKHSISDIFITIYVYIVFYKLDSIIFFITLTALPR